MAMECPLTTGSYLLILMRIFMKEKMRPQKGQNNLLQGHGKNQLEAESRSVIPKLSPPYWE